MSAGNQATESEAAHMSKGADANQRIAAAQDELTPTQKQHQQQATKDANKGPHQVDSTVDRPVEKIETKSNANIQEIKKDGMIK